MTEEQKQELRAQLRLPIDAYIVAYVGRISPEKGVIDLIKAVQHVRSDTLLWLLVVGSADEAHSEYESTVHEMAGLNVQFLKPREDVEAVYQLADLVVVPSHSESFGRVVVEALACATPVARSHVAGIPEILGRRQDMIFPSGNIRAIANLIEQRARGSIIDDRDDILATAAQFDERTTVERIAAALAAVASRHTRLPRCLE